MLPFFISDEMGFSDEELLLFAAASGKAVEDTATGNPLVFTTDLAKPLKSLLIPFTPRQSGTGDPSPENIRPIVPWEGLTMWHGGENLFDEAYTDINDDMHRAYIFVGDNVVTISTTCPTSQYGSACLFIQSGKVTSGESTDGNGVESNRTRTVIPTDGYITISYRTASGTDPRNYETMLNFGNVALPYEPYKPITETDTVFPSPVYGGTLDVVSGVLTVEYGTVDLGTLTYEYLNQNTNRQAWTIASNIPKKIVESNTDLYNGYCSIFKRNAFSGTWMPYNIVPYGNPLDKTVVCFAPNAYETPEEVKTALDGVILCYELATPQTVQLTAEQISALVGQNTMWSDADGSMTAVYLKKG